MEENMTHVHKCVYLAKEQIEAGLENNGYAIIDNFLGKFVTIDGDLVGVCNSYRKEAEGIYNRGELKVSKSTRWDSSKEQIVSYNKVNVLATQLEGGLGYDSAPRLHEYVVATIGAIVPFISKKFPESLLCSNLASNKLAVCLGDGSSYDKHYDNSGPEDLRKLTILLYLNPNWRPELQGYFRLYLSKSCMAKDDLLTINIDTDGFAYKDIAPINDRLLVFWSDRTVHSVQPSQIFNDNKADHRYALTIWIASEHSSAIIQDDEEVLKHFGVIKKERDFSSK